MYVTRIEIWGFVPGFGPGQLGYAMDLIRTRPPAHHPCGMKTVAIRAGADPSGCDSRRAITQSRLRQGRVLGPGRPLKCRRLAEGRFARRLERWSKIVLVMPFTPRAQPTIAPSGGHPGGRTKRPHHAAPQHSNRTRCRTHRRPTAGARAGT